MSIETLQQARNSGVRITVRCVYGKREAMKSVRECVYRYELDLDTLIWTRGAQFPVSMLAERLKCPQCGSRRVALLFDLPGNPLAKRA